MWYIPKFDEYLKILTVDEVEDFVVKHFGEYFKSAKEKLYSKLFEEQNIRKVAEFLYIFLMTSDEVHKYVEMMQSNSSASCVHPYNIEILNLFDPELQLINTKPMIRNKLLSALKKLKVWAILVTRCKKRNHRKI